MPKTIYLSIFYLINLNWIVFNSKSPVKSLEQVQKISTSFFTTHEPPFLHTFVGHVLKESAVVVIIVVVVTVK
jgi:hypothetical protein